MPDNIYVTPGTGVLVACDDISGVFYQRIKLTDGTPDSEQYIPGTSGFGLYVDVRRLPSGDADFVRTKGYFSMPSVSFTRPANTTAYAVNDAISDSTSAPFVGGFVFRNVVDGNNRHGIITDAIVVTNNDPATLLQGEMFIFNSSIANINDNAAFAVSDPHIKSCLGKIPFTLEDVGNNGFYHAQNLNIGFMSLSGDLRMLVRAKNAYTPASAEQLTFTIKVMEID
jgi:hypothetical protein